MHILTVAYLNNWRQSFNISNVRLSWFSHTMLWSKEARKKRYNNYLSFNEKIFIHYRIQSTFGDITEMYMSFAPSFVSTVRLLQRNPWMNANRLPVYYWKHVVASTWEVWSRQRIRHCDAFGNMQSDKYAKNLYCTYIYFLLHCQNKLRTVP